MNIMHNKMEKFITHLRYATQCGTTQHREVSKYQLISQTKLDKFQLQCYGKYSKWWPLISMQQCRPLCHWSTASLTVVAETRESVIGYQATRVRCPST